uniref:Tim44 domain-containing protein n=1 Tax=Desulfatirhabdium butyrativorans TaxID=340467 RepID=A0A7C4W6B9_9BACT
MHANPTRFMAMIVLALVATLLWLADDTFARVGSGGRSFGGSGGSGGRTFSSPSAPSRSAPPPPPGGGFTRSMPDSGGSSFWRGVGGGLLGGMIGGMIFGRPSYGYGGGFGGSGFGLIELLLLGGLGYFLYKRFIKNRTASSGMPLSSMFGTGNTPPPPAPGPGYDTIVPEVDSISETFRIIRQTEPDFDPERFKEIAQDVFFRLQAAWMRRDLAPVLGLLGDQLKSEYLATMEDLKNRKLINKLENIAVRKIELLDAGIEGNEVYITLQFQANLLDYTVHETTGEIVSGSNTEPVKFEERWTFARPINSTAWKLEGVQA